MNQVTDPRDFTSAELPDDIARLFTSGQPSQDVVFKSSREGVKTQVNHIHNAEYKNAQAKIRLLTRQLETQRRLLTKGSNSTKGGLKIKEITPSIRAKIEDRIVKIEAALINAKQTEARYLTGPTYISEGNIKPNDAMHSIHTAEGFIEGESINLGTNFQLGEESNPVEITGDGLHFDIDTPPKDSDIQDWLSFLHAAKAFAVAEDNLSFNKTLRAMSIWEEESDLGDFPTVSERDEVDDLIMGFSMEHPHITPPIETVVELMSHISMDTPIDTGNNQGKVASPENSGEKTQIHGLSDSETHAISTRNTIEGLVKKLQDFLQLLQTQNSGEIKATFQNIGIDICDLQSSEADAMVDQIAKKLDLNAGIGETIKHCLTQTQIPQLLAILNNYSPPVAIELDTTRVIQNVLSKATVSQTPLGTLSIPNVPRSVQPIKEPTTFQKIGGWVKGLFSRKSIRGNGGLRRNQPPHTIAAE